MSATASALATMRSPDRHRAARDAWIALAALLLIVAWEWSGLDLWLTAKYGSAAGFAWRDHWLTRDALHAGGRYLTDVALAVMALLTIGPRRTSPRAAGQRYWLLVTVACLLLVPALKRLSSTSCPWDLALYGGSAAYVPHWLPGLSDGGPGHCFPSGHAVAAFAFFGAYFMLRPHHPKAARVVLLAVLLVGGLFGWAQLARGAHFASHTLWSAWLCWAACAIADAWAPARRAAVPLPLRTASPRG